jgi:hypothetical protein
MISCQPVYAGRLFRQMLRDVGGHRADLVTACLSRSAELPKAALAALEDDALADITR